MRSMPRLVNWSTSRASSVVLLPRLQRGRRRTAFGGGGRDEHHAEPGATGERRRPATGRGRGTVS